MKIIKRVNESLEDFILRGMELSQFHRVPIELYHDGHIQTITYTDTPLLSNTSQNKNIKEL